METEHLERPETGSSFTDVAGHYRSGASHRSNTGVLLSSQSWTSLPSNFPFATDDAGVQQDPTRLVDYLNHDWREEDVSSSWRYVVSSKKTIELHTRLENAAWRAWAKRINDLSTLHPKELNWYVRRESHRVKHN